MISIEKGEAITPEKRPINLFRLHTKGMMGDADGYTHESFDIPCTAEGVEKLHNCLLIIAGVCRLSHNETCDEMLVTKTIEEKGKELGIKYPTDLWGDMVGYDVTCEGRWCSLESAKVVFYSETGDAYRCKINIDGRVFDALRRECLFERKPNG